MVKHDNIVLYTGNQVPIELSSEGILRLDNKYYTTELLFKKFKSEIKNAGGLLVHIKDFHEFNAFLMSNHELFQSIEVKIAFDPNSSNRDLEIIEKIQELCWEYHFDYIGNDESERIIQVLEANQWSNMVMKNRQASPAYDSSSVDHSKLDAADEYFMNALEKIQSIKEMIETKDGTVDRYELAEKATLEFLSIFSED